MAQNREKLESAAQELVQRRGMGGLSFRKLAEHVGIKSSSVHYHFPEKSDLASALIQRYSETFFNHLDTIERSDQKLQHKLSQFIDVFEKVGRENKLCLCGMMAAELEQLSDENREQLNAYFDNTEKWLVHILEHHKNEFSTNINRPNIARAILSALEGALLLDRVQGNSKHLAAQRLVILQMVSD